MQRTISGLTLWQLIQAVGATMPFSFVVFLNLANPAVLSDDWKTGHPVLTWMLDHSMLAWSLASLAAFSVMFWLQVFVSRRMPGSSGLLLGSSLVVVVAWTLVGNVPDIPSRGLLPP
jgi:hypothetical protein